MAKIKRPNKKYPSKTTVSQPAEITWSVNKIAYIRQIAVRLAPRASRTIFTLLLLALAGTVLLSLSLPKDRFQLAKEQVLNHPNDLSAHLTLAEEFLNHQQLTEAEQELLQVKRLSQTPSTKTKVLGLNTKIDDLWTRWLASNPTEVQKKLEAWEQVVIETPTYRDGWLYLALYAYQMGQNFQARDYLSRAIELDPNSESLNQFSESLPK